MSWPTCLVPPPHLPVPPTQLIAIQPHTWFYCTGVYHNLSPGIIINIAILHKKTRLPHPFWISFFFTHFAQIFALLKRSFFNSPCWLGTILQAFPHSVHLLFVHYPFCHHANNYCQQNFHPLKVLTNEKRGGLKVVAFDKSPFKLFTLRFSTKSVQAPSCKRPKTNQRTLFLSFEINNCFPVTV